jgi:hypothetical protein
VSVIAALPHFTPHLNTHMSELSLVALPYLAGFEWDPEEDYTRFIVHQTNNPTSSFTKDGSSKKKNKKKAEGIEE